MVPVLVMMVVMGPALVMLPRMMGMVLLMMPRRMVRMRLTMGATMATATVPAATDNGRRRHRTNRQRRNCGKTVT